MQNLFQPIRNFGFLKRFLVALPLITGLLLFFINPAKLDAGDFILIAWNPAQELIKTGSIYANYPYPLWTVVVMLPFSIWPAQISMLLWFISNVIMLAASLSIMISLFGWEISPFLITLLVSLSALFLPVLTSIWLGQLTIFTLLILALTIYLFLHQHWTGLGIVIGLSFIKPQIMLLLAGLLLLWSLWHRRWKVLLGFGVVMILLFLISLPFISSPGQIIGGGIGYHLATYIKMTSTIWGLLLSLGLPWCVPLAISLCLLAWLGWIWWPGFRKNDMSSNRVLFLFSSATLVNLIVVPYSWLHNLLLLLLPFGYSLALALKLKSRERYVWMALLFITMQPLMWGLFFGLTDPTHTQAYQIIPALILLPIMCFLEFSSSL